MADDQTEAEKLAAAVRDAKPFWMDGLGVRGKQPTTPPTQSPDVQRRSDKPKGEIVRQPRATAETDTTNAVAPTTSSLILPVNFYLSDASTSEGDPPVVSNKVLVLDGKIVNGSESLFPTGMGGDDYVLDIPDPSDCIIFAGATFNPQTLALDSRFLDTSTALDFPESRVESDTSGFLYWQLGFTYFDDDGVFQVRNSRLGDIWVELIYSSQNGQPALWAGAQIGFLDLNFT